MALCLKLLGNVRRDLLAYDNGCLYTVCDFIHICLHWVLMRWLGREAPLDQQVRKSHGCDTVTSVNSRQGVCTSKRRHLKSFNNFMTVKLDWHITAWSLKLQTPATCLKVIYFSLGPAYDVIKHTLDACDIQRQPKGRLNPRCNFSLSFSCIVSFSLRGRGQ